MKKVLILALALFLIVGLVPMTAMAEATAVNVKFTNPGKVEFTVSVQPGATAYVTSDDELKFVNHTDAEAPTDKFVKLELSADGSALNVTFKNINVNSADTSYKHPAVEFPAGNYKVTLELLGENRILERHSSCILNNNDGGLTITGEGSLAMNVGIDEATTGAATGALWANGGDLLIKNTTLSFTVISSASSKHHAIFSGKGNVAIEGAKITSDTTGGQLIYTGLASAKNPRYTMDTDPNRFVTIKDSVLDVKAKLSSFQTTNPIKITNSTVTVAKKSSSSGSTEEYAIFWPAPEFVGEHTAIAGLLKNAENLAKLKPYEVKKLTSYTYFHMVPGIVELLPTEPTEPEVTVPEETTPEETTPEATTPEETTPEETTPEATQPQETQPTQPAETKPAETTPNVTEPADTDAEEGGNPLVTVIIVIGVLIVLAGGGVAALFILKKKGIIK